MMTFDSILQLQTLVASNALLAAAAVLALARNRGRRQEPRPGSDDALPAAPADLGQRLLELQAMVNELAQGEGPRQPSLEEAVRLARGGAGTEVLRQRCSLSRGEAELLARLHGGRS